MAKSRAFPNLLGLVASDSEDDLGVVEQPVGTARSKPSIRDMPPAKLSRPSSTAAGADNKVAKPKQKTAVAARRAAEKRSAAAAAAVAATATDNDNNDENGDGDGDDAADATTTSKRGRRVVLADRTNEQTAEAPADAGGTKKRGRGRPKAMLKAMAASEVASNKDEEDEMVDEPNTRSENATRTATGPRLEDEEGDTEEVIAGNYVGVMKMDEEHQHTEAEARKQSSPAPRQTASAFLSPQRLKGATTTMTADSDVALRRRLGELTKKYDGLEARYRDLKEIGVKEAERHFDRLKKQSDERAKASNDLIAGLKAELASYRALAQEGGRTKRALDTSEARAADLQKQVTELTTALGESRAEAKTLATKLAAARSTAAETAASQILPLVPGSAIKGGVGSSAAAKAAMQASSQTAQLKEDLYGDLTGLLVRSAKREAIGSSARSRSREMYDCIQTGRNGSLHFKLCIEVDDEAGGGAGGKGGTAPDNVQFVYTPQLDPNRDEILIQRLPDYLVEEISFPRAQAAKFYKRVMQSLTEDIMA